MMDYEFFEKIFQLVHNFEVLVICFNIKRQISSINYENSITKCICPYILNGLFVIIDEMAIWIILGLSFDRVWFGFCAIFIRILTKKLINGEIAKVNIETTTETLVNRLISGKSFMFL